MSMNIVQTFIALAVNALISFGLYSFHKGDNTLILGVGSFIALSIPGVLSIGIELKNSRAATNVRLMAGIVYPLMLIINLAFLFIRFDYIPYVLVNGIVLLLFTSMAYRIGKARQ